MNHETFQAPFREARATFRTAPHRELFRSFYENTLRLVPGCRIGARDLHTAHEVWAGANGIEPLSHRDLAAYIGDAGHRKMRSNGIIYLDAGFAVDHPQVVAHAPLQTVPVEVAGALVADALQSVNNAMTYLAGVQAALMSCFPVEIEQVATPCLGSFAGTSTMRAAKAHVSRKS